MKKNILFLTIVITATLASCNDLLELPNDGRITMDEVFKTRNSVTGFLNSCYQYRLGPSMERDELTDNAQSSEDMFGNSLPNRWYNNGYSASNYSNTDGSPWDQLYQGIRKCNIFITNMETLDPSTILNYDGEISSWIAQAQTLRAYYYLELIKRYGACPVITTPYETTHDFSGDVRAPVSAVVAQIVADCDAALAAPEINLGFAWRVGAGSGGIMTRAMSHFIKAQALLFAASPQFADGTYTWADALNANKAALGACLAHGYELFTAKPNSDVAQNAYAYYFISASDEQQAFDKEFIYAGAGVNIWQTSGLPTTAGQSTAGVCPTQELVDCYEMQATGLPPITGYNDAQHLSPIINTASGYDEKNPYVGRDPRFYASVYFNEAERQLGEPGLGRDDHFPLSLNGGELNQITFSENDGEYKLISTGGDPYINTSAIGTPLNAPPGSIYIRMQYKSSERITKGEFFFCKPNAAGGIETGQVLVFEKADDWTDWEVDITDWAQQFTWGTAENHRLRFDFATDPDITFYCRDLEVVVQSTIAAADPVQTFVGGAEGLSAADRRYTHTGYYLRKYNNWKSNKDNSADGQIRKFRLAELYLNFAEAAYQANSSPADKVDLGNGLSMSAIDAVNAIRSRAEMPDFPASMSKAEFETKYRNERRVELAFEDVYYFDVRRWKIMPETSRYVSGMRITPDGAGYKYERFSIERASYLDKYYLYPLSITEANKMTDHTGSQWQNPGW